MDSDKRWEDLDLSSDEVKRLTEALKKEEFRKLLAEYAEEISDPENRKKYEEEIAQLEREKGMDVKFVNPDPGYVIKTSDGKVKAFINICKNEHIEKPKCTKKVGPIGKSGYNWSIPHSFAPVREDADKVGSKCKVIDFVVHPETYRMAESNIQFKNMLHDTAFEGIEKQFDIKLDRRNIKFPKMKFKGQPTATVIRTKRSDATASKPDPDDPLNKVQYPYSDKSSEEVAKERAAEIAKRKAKKETEKSNVESQQKNDDTYETPRHSIVHRGYFDLQDFRHAPDAKASTRPKELVVDIDLPLLKSAANVDLDVMEKKIKLQCDTPAKYKLEIDLPYPVDEEKGGAKFDKSKHKLIVTLPVLPAEIPSLPFGANSEPEQLNGAETTAEAKLPCTESWNKPLIQVLSSEENLNREGGDSLATGDASDLSNTEESNGSKGEVFDEPPNTAPVENAKDSPKFYSFPPFDYLQDDETVTVILDVKNGVRESVRKHFLNIDGECRGLELTMTSMGSGGFPMNYKCMVKFPEGCLIEEENSYVDVGIHNIVVTFIKKDNCLGAWETFQIGQSEDALEEQVFLSEKNLTSELNKLDKELASHSPVNLDEMPDIDVKDMDSSQLTIQIQEKSGLRRSVSESAEEIEVVHEKKVPKLHGILKQRTMSESSDDLSASFNRQISAGDSNSPISESDENAEYTSGDDNGTERKKSVSFSEHVDSALFKQNQTVTSMRKALTNKRKKQKKYDKKHGGRRRRNSNSVSEISSDEVLTDDSNKKKPENGSKDKKGDKTVKDKQHVAKASSEKSSSENNMKNETVPADENSESQSNNEIQRNQEQTDSCEEGTNDVTKTKTKNDITDENEVKTENERTNKGYDSDDFDEKESEEKDAGNFETVPPKDPDAPETMLNWNEGPCDESLKPKCAVALSNSVMFDLDVD